MNEASPTAASVKDLLNLYPRLGVPHFQRGLVWTNDSMSLLLESLYFGTPCGNIILWRPKQPKAHGVPLDQSSPSPDYDRLILDGQQRIRTLHELFADGVDSGELEEGADDEEVAEDRTWCIDLTVEPSFMARCDQHDRRRSLFVYIQNPLLPRRVKRFNFIPLDLLKSSSELPPTVLGLVQVRDGIADVPQALESIRNKTKGMMRSNLFSVIELTERDDEHRLGDVVRLYNRINSGGSRVAAEEKAFATLVRLSPSVNDHIRSYFHAVHGADQEHDALSARDDMLQRRKESRFGFKLYIRTFTQLCNYHFARSCGTSGFSFGILDSHELQARFTDPALAAKVESLHGQTTHILSAIRRVLNGVLNCDDLRMLPEPAFFVPVIHLMARYPELSDAAYDPCMGYLMLRLALRDAYSQAKFLELVGIIERSHNAGDCLRAISKRLGTAESARQKLGESLKYSNSLASRHVLLLYWLIRRNKALDLSYKNLPTTNPLYTAACPEPMISVACSPEKQHLVPASKAGRLYGASSRVATSSHWANNIGNLTFISHKLNCLEGLSDTWVNPALESTLNRMAHYLHEDQIGDSFQRMVDRPENCTRAAYEQFIQKRRAAIAEGFMDWLLELESAFHIEDRIRPSTRHFYTQEADCVRALDFPDDVEDAIIKMLPGLKREKSRKKKPCMTIKRRRGEPALNIYLLAEPAGRIEIDQKDDHPLVRAISACMQQYGYSATSDCPFCQTRHQPARWIIPVADQSAGPCLAQLADVVAPKLT